MKKVFYILLVSLMTSLSIVACTEEEVTPTTESGNGGGGVSEKPQ
jgi:hypothetical protein